MIPAFVFYGIARCVTHLYVQKFVEQFILQPLW